MSSIHPLLERIAALQSAGSRYYAEGLFPSVRSYAGSWIRRQDNNIFFTAITVFTLERLKFFLNDAEKKLVEQIRQKAIQNYPDYQSKKGKKTYNFWRNDPSQHFPHGYFFSKIPSLELPDDADDSVMIYLTQKNSYEDALWLKTTMEKESRLKAGQFKNFPKDYQDFQAYATFFSTAALPMDHSLCVLCNILYFVYAYDLPKSTLDQESLVLISKAIETEDYRKIPVDLALHYPSAPIILYHITRLMVDFDIPPLNLLKPRLKENLREMMQEEKKAMNRLLLAISMGRLGMHPKTSYDLSPGHKKIRDFPFFMFSKWSYYRSVSVRKLARIPFFQVNFACEAFNLSLLLEYELLKKNKI